MALLRPAWMQATGGDAAITYTAAQDRQVLAAIFSREGVLDKDAGHLRVTQRAAGANFSVDIAKGKVAIVGDDISDQGVYLCESTATENRSIPSAPGSGTRNHRVIARIRDKMHNGIWTGYEWVIEVQQDTGSGTPALPASAVPLAIVSVSSATTSITNGNITQDLRPRSSVGTPWLTGALLESGFGAGYGTRDGTRPLTWMKNPDGWVFLSGWVARSADGGSYTPAGNFYRFDGSANINVAAPILPPEARPSGIRDAMMMTSNGPAHIAFYPGGSCQFRFKAIEPASAGGWFSFDGIVFRATPFS